MSQPDDLVTRALEAHRSRVSPVTPETEGDGWSQYLQEKVRAILGDGVALEPVRVLAQHRQMVQSVGNLKFALVFPHHGQPQFLFRSFWCVRCGSWVFRETAVSTIEDVGASIAQHVEIHAREDARLERLGVAP